MTVYVERVDNASRWNELVEKAPTATPFHRFEALRTMADHSEAELYPLVGRSRHGPVGLFPVFSESIGPMTVAFSPPPALKVSYLGPAYIPDGLGSDGTHKRLRSGFIDAVTEFVDEFVDPRYVHVRAAPEYDDPRPLVWNDYRPMPRYTYVIDLTPSVDDLFMSFSGDLRENVRGADDDAYDVTEGSPNDIDRIIDRLQARHDEQGVAFPLTQAFARDLYDALPDGDMRVYVCRSDDEFVGGQLILENESAMLAWQGVGDHDHGLPVNDLLDWHAIRDARSRGLDRYDLVGANAPRLCRYKAKYNSRLATYYVLERSGPLTDLLKRGYQWGRSATNWIDRTARSERR
ncbi:GNAT family N-acetyltransferase [Halorubrum sp. DTA98]|uniref:GNAT family N-acetyltransferase n=1 Tax=Halorubrum sp. DTA98 TaxID=3402163 RepID=UPI003AB08181